MSGIIAREATDSVGIHIGSFSLSELWLLETKADFSATKGFIRVLKILSKAREYKSVRTSGSLVVSFQ